MAKRPGEAGTEPRRDRLLLPFEERRAMRSALSRGGRRFQGRQLRNREVSAAGRSFFALAKSKPSRVQNFFQNWLQKNRFERDLEDKCRRRQTPHGLLAVKRLGLAARIALTETSRPRARAAAPPFVACRHHSPNAALSSAARRRRGGLARRRRRLAGLEEARAGSCSGAQAPTACHRLPRSCRRACCAGGGLQRRIQPSLRPSRPRPAFPDGDAPSAAQPRRRSRNPGGPGERRRDRA